MKKKATRGGAREGAGRPKLPKSKLKEKTKVMRIPLSLVPVVKKLIKETIKKDKNNGE